MSKKGSTKNKEKRRYSSDDDDSSDSSDSPNERTKKNRNEVKYTIFERVSILDIKLRFISLTIQNCCN